MDKGRLEAFSDGVIAVIITIMVLELRAPVDPVTHETAITLRSLCQEWPTILAYVLSFLYVGIYWNNHHHLWHAASKVNGAILWANLHLLFWLSLVPFATDWMGESRFAAQPVAFYGFLLLMSSIAFAILLALMVRCHGQDSLLAKAVGRDRKGKISTLIYAIGIAGTFISAWLGFALYAIVAAIWLIPDRRIESRIEE